jgi:hypothetical protein
MEAVTHQQPALGVHRQGYHSVLRPLPRAIRAHRAQTPVGHKSGLARLLPASATEQGLVGKVPFIANEKVFSLAAGRSAIYGTSEVCCAGC